jgi:hypothetical protein
LEESKWNRSEEEIAEDVVNSQAETVKDILRKDAERSGLSRFLLGSFAMEFLNRSVEEVDGKKMYSVHLRLLTGGDAVFRDKGLEKKQFLYFIPDFAKTHTVYTFSIFKVYPRSIIPPHDRVGLGEKDMFLVHEIISSLQLK